MSFTNPLPSVSWKSHALATDGLVDAGAEFIGEVPSPVNKLEPATVSSPDAGARSATEVPAPWVGGVEC